jgi:hypothetical protein
MLTGVTSYGMNQGYDDKEMSSAQIKALKREGVIECKECATRKYRDGSNESNVSFKAAAHISPSSSASKVMAHEQEHVGNAYAKAAKGNGEVVNASVTLKTAICPECGKSYVSGGVTHTMIKYNNQTPYGANQKSNDYSQLAGKTIDYGV